MFDKIFVGSVCLLLSLILSFCIWLVRDEKDFCARSWSVGCSLIVVALLAASIKSFSLL